ncbi:MAG: carbon starvation protein A [Acidobacteria bacterium]|nr:carbon starvation protein A [Acidobacteriota bacterium]
MKRLLNVLLWVAISLGGAAGLGAIAIERDEPINAVWFIVAAVCVYLVAYRFYSSFIAAKVLTLDETRATPAERLDDGRDFVPTNKWILFGHHFAAIAGPGPLIGPTLAAQFGYLPGTLWLIVGAVLGGCVQDFIVLFGSTRRNGKSLGQMAREEVSKLSGMVAMIAVLAIMVILLAAIALVVVNALKASPWATYTMAMSMPIAVLMGFYLRFWRPGRVIEATIIGVGLLLFAVVSGEWVAASSTWAQVFTLSGTTLAIAIILYGFAASTLPVWLLLAPRDYLNSFIKLGVVFLLGLGIIFTRPEVQMPALTRFADGTGPIFAGGIFPFCFITIACGAVSGFHSLISSGTTPKMIMHETQARMIGYGSMLLESFVGVMAMIAACVLQPGVFFAINSPAGVVGDTVEKATATITAWGFPVSAATMDNLARLVGEETLLNRTGGAPSLAVGMATIFSNTIGGEAMIALWYHFAIMFEVLFILTVLDSGTRVGRFMLQDLLGHFWKPLGRTGWTPGVLITSVLIVAAWGHFLYQGVLDPLGGINSLWPLFGISNQLLATVALIVMTTILIKMGKLRYIWVTLTPSVWLVAVTMTASYQKIFSANPRIGFLAQARQMAERLATGSIAPDKVVETERLIFNAQLNAGVTALLAGLVIVVVLSAAWEWYRLLSGRRASDLQETPYVATQFALGD